MRTTVTLDSDVERLLKDEAHKRGESFKVALNEAVRQAFRTRRTSRQALKPFMVKARSLGLRHGLDPARLGELADDMETEAFLALSRKMRRKK